LVFTAAGLIWLDPNVMPYVLLTVIISLSLPLIVQPMLGEMQFSVANYRGAMSRYYLDALRGAIPLRTHGAEHTLKTEHDGMVSAWAGARIKHLRASLAINLVITLVGMSLAGLIVFVHLIHSREGASVLLLIYWAQQLPALGRGLAGSLLRYPAQRAIALRLLEPLDAADDRQLPAATGISAGASTPTNQAGVTIGFENLGVRLGSQTILEGISADIPAGARCAVVGRSGAGKTTLLGLLLGWHAASSGNLRVDGRTLDAAGLAALHSELAWIDPQVQIWNQPLIHNLTYDPEPEALANLAEVIGLVNLKPVIQRLPQGLDTPLGEAGGLLSEDEGQRVRIARAMLKRHASLVLMDEPFRGLDLRAGASCWRRPGNGGRRRPCCA
jgi:ATP-binding cassette subfamily B protein